MLNKAPDNLHKNNFSSFGRYKGLIADTDIASWQSGFADRRLKRKGWLYAGIYNAEFAIGYAIADTGYLGKAFIYCYHFPTKTFIEEAAQFPFYFSNDFMPSLNTEWRFSSGNKIWQISPNHDDLEFRFESKKLKVDFTLINYKNGMSTIAPAQNRPFNFTFKNAAITTKATIQLQSKEYVVDGKFAVLDFTLGFPPRETKWHWASATGTTENQKSIGINLVALFNESLENVLFVDGNLYPLDKAVFRFSEPADKTPWHIKTNDGVLDMHFYPEGARKDYINVGFLKHQFIQPFGKFEGKINVDGNCIAFTAYGVTENHHSIW